MYKTVQKYKMAKQSDMAINTAIVETLVNPHNNQDEITVVHMYGDSCLVEQDLSVQYQLPANISLYQIRTLISFDNLKKSGIIETCSTKHLFMFNKDNGMWDSRWPDYPSHRSKFPTFYTLGSYTSRTIRSESTLVPEMRKSVEKKSFFINRSINRSYICPVNPNHQTKFADLYIECPWLGEETKKFNLAKRRFNYAFKKAHTQTTR